MTSTPQRAESSAEHGPPSGRESLNPLSHAERVAVTASPVQAEDPAARWLVQLRWVAVVGMAATVLIANRIVDTLRLAPILGAIAAIALINVAWFWVSRQRRWEVPRQIEAQISLDVVLLSAVLWFAGGLTNPFAAFLTYQVALAGLLCTPRTTFQVAALALAAVFILSLAEPLTGMSATTEMVGRVLSICSLVGFFAVVVSVYARRLAKLRGESHRNEKLAMVGRLVGGMSHELNTPLGTIQLTSQELETYWDEVEPDERRQMIRDIAEEARRAHAIIGLVRGHIGPDQPLIKIDVASFVREFAAEELDRLGYTGRRVFSTTEVVNAPVVRAALAQVLVNLLKNAAEASATGRRRRIAVIVERVAPARAEIRVEDRGPGFAPDVLNRLGEPFSTTKQADGGMGMGLYVSSALAQTMGAVLSVQSVQGGGARVTLAFDCDPPA